MNILSGPQDIYKELVDQSNENWLFGLVAFAVIEEQRIEWMRHYEGMHGTLPTDQQIHEWYGQQPTGVLLRAKGTAESALKAYAQQVTEMMEDDYIRAIQESALIEEIRSHNRFWPQFSANVVAGLVSTIIFSFILIVIAMMVLHDPSPIGTLRQIQESAHGK